MVEWQAAKARRRFGDVVNAACAGEPQFVRRKDGKEVVVVSRDYFLSTQAGADAAPLRPVYAEPAATRLDTVADRARP